MSAAIAPAVKKVAQSLDENQNGIRAQRRQSPDYMPTERTSTASYKSPSTGKKKPKPVEPESLTGLSAALDYISSPVRYLTSVFSQPEPQKSPPKPRLKPRNMARVVESKSPKPAEIVQLPETESAQVTIADTPPEGLESLSSELLEPIIEKKVELVQHVAGKEKKPVPITSDHKKSSDPKRSSSQLMKSVSKTRISFSTKNYRDQKRQSPSPTIRMPPASPRILSASSIKFASKNNRSYRVTSTEKEDSAAKAKKSGKKVFKIDMDRSPINSSKSQSSSTTTEKRDEVAHSYLPLNAIEISRL